MGKWNHRDEQLSHHPKGLVTGCEIFPRKDEAKEFARRARRSGLRATVARRCVKLDSVRIDTWAVVTRIQEVER